MVIPKTNDIMKESKGKVLRYNHSLELVILCCLSFGTIQHK